MNRTKPRAQNPPHRSLLSRLVTLCVPRRNRCVIAACTGCLMLFFAWFGDRSTTSTGYDQFAMKMMRGATLLLSRHGELDSPDWNDRYLLINTSYDRVLAEVSDEFGVPLGYTDITDHGAILRLLDMLEGIRCKGVILDILISRNPSVSSTDSLIERINSFPGLYLPFDPNERTEEGIFSPSHLGYSAYETNIYTGDFIKYSFLGPQGVESLALRAYREISGDTSRPGLMSQPTIMLPIRYRLASPLQRDGDKTWYNLTSDILSYYTASDLERLAEGKTIIIGDFVDRDIHDTYIGPVAGPAITVNAIEALRRGDNRISLLSALLSAVTYLAVCFSLIFNFSLSRVNYIKWLPSFLRYLLSLAGYSLVLMLLWIVQYLVFNEFHDTQLVMYTLALYALFCQKLNDKYPA